MFTSDIQILVVIVLVMFTGISSEITCFMPCIITVIIIIIIIIIIIKFLKC